MNTFVHFLDITLDFISYINSCGGFEQLYFIDSDNNKIGFKNKYGDTLFFKEVYENMSKGEIKFYIDNNQYIFRFEPFKFEVGSVSSDIVSKLNDMLLYINYSPFSDKLNNIFSSEIEEFKRDRQHLLEYYNIFDTPEKVIDYYLDSYFKLIISFFINYDSNYAKTMNSFILLDTYYDNSNEFCYSLYSPLFLKNILNIRKIIDKEYSKINKNNLLIFKSIFIDNVKKMFEFEVLNDENNMCKTYFEGDILKLKNINDFSPTINPSLINYFYIPSLTMNSNKDTIKVSVIGNVTPSSITLLYEKLVNSNIIDNQKIILEVYPDSKIDVDEKYSDCIKVIDDIKPLFDVKYLNRIIEESDSLFLFDTIDIYRKKANFSDELRSNYNSMRQSIRSFDYNENDSLYRIITATAKHYFSVDSLVLPIKMNKDMIGIISSLCNKNNTVFYSFINEKLHDDFFWSKDSMIELNGLFLPDLFDKNEDMVCYSITDDFNNIIENVSLSGIKKLNEYDDYCCCMSFCLRDFYNYVIKNEIYIEEFSTLTDQILDTIISIDYSNLNSITIKYSNDMVDKDECHNHLTSVFLPLINITDDYPDYIDVARRVQSFFINNSKNIGDLLFLRYIYAEKIEKNFNIEPSKENISMYNKSNSFPNRFLYEIAINNWVKRRAAVCEFDLRIKFYYNRIKHELSENNSMSDEVTTYCKKLGYYPGYLIDSTKMLNDK